MTLLTGRMTAAEFMDLPEDPHKTRYELVHGEIVVSPSPNFDHAYVVSRLLTVIAPYLQQSKRGVIVSDIDTPFGPEDVRRPDLLHFARERLHLIVDSKLQGAPDLCVEVLSPSNRHVDRGDKFKLYRDSGVPFYWILDPMLKSIETFRLVDKEYIPAVTAKDDAIVRVPPFEAIEIPLVDIWWPAQFS